ncbi:hypothetical protein [Microtetraspora sp. NBRC 13810]|uniref:class I SAM-dependent methyltransferase n=1 Tax=Microtetraspora sp. NBRC 13810 TaxID=3030990 RepID=UPI00331FD2A4
MTAYLQKLGLDIFGLDLSPVMIDLAREAYQGPALRGRFDGRPGLGRWRAAGDRALVLRHSYAPAGSVWPRWR